MTVPAKRLFLALAAPFVALLWGGCPAADPLLADPLAEFGQKDGSLKIDTVTPTIGTVDGDRVALVRGAGFVPGMTVMFGDEEAKEVTFISDTMLTALVPPHEAGAVDVSLAAELEGVPRTVVLAGSFTFALPPPDDGTDTDGDGLTDVQESIVGWRVKVDFYGLGLNPAHLTKFNVNSDPLDPDTDDDGLLDNEEFFAKTNPRDRDTDTDGLWDGEEAKRWWTSPISVDSDGDARANDPSTDRSTIPPVFDLFDGAELFTPAELSKDPADRGDIKPRATSPTLDDTDGDGVSDFDEFDSTVRNSVLADLPLLNYELVGDVDVNLNVEYAESIGQTKEYGVTLTESRSETVASSFSNTIGWSLDVMVGVEIGNEAGGLDIFKLQSTVTTEITAGIHGEYTWTNSHESSRESSKELSRVQSDSREFTETAADGAIRTAILLTNAGNTTYTVDGLGVLVSKFGKKKALGDLTPPERTTVATMTLAAGSITLAPGETGGPFELAATGVNAQSIKELMAAPDTLMLGTAALSLTDSTGLDFDFVREVTVAQTAHLIIDLGDGEVRQYNVATNVDRNPDASYRGITLKRVLEDYVGIPYNTARGYTTMVNPAPGSNFQVLESLLGRRYTELNGVPVAFWTAVASNGVRTNGDFNAIVLHAGDELALMFQRDDDGDGLPNNLEVGAGTDVNVDPNSPGDADLDGVSDYDEVIKGWVAFADPNDPGMQWATSVIDFSSEYDAGDYSAAQALGEPDTLSYGGSGAQWASYVIDFSSEYGSPDYSAAQALGAPDTFAYGDFATAWAPGPQNGTLEYITVGYATPVYAGGATIRETSGNGMVYQVDVVDTNDVLHTVWTGADPSLPGAPVDFLVTWPTTTYLVKGIRVYVDTDHDLSVWEQIDAIALNEGSPMAWRPASQNGTLEYITVGFPTPVYASSATIRETSGNGMVYQVDVVDMNDVLRTVWTGTDPSQPGAPENFVVTWPVTTYLVKGVKVYTDTDYDPDAYEEIDAIGLHGYPDRRARRVLPDPRLPDADEDGLTDFDERRGWTPNPGIRASSDPLDPDTDGDGLLDGVDPFPTIPATIAYVKADGTTGAFWPAVHTTIQDAIAAAAVGQATPMNPDDDVAQIWVARGEYKPASELSPIQLADGVQIYGGFSGPDGVSFAGETKRGQRNTNAFSNGCVISGDLAGNDIGGIDLDSPGTYASNCPKVIMADASVTSSALLDGFLITGAYAEIGEDGGALSLLGSPTIQNCLITGNGNQAGGAGVRATGASAALFRRCILAGNVANYGGGAYLTSTGQIVFEACEFSQNEARAIPNTPSPGSLDYASKGGGAYLLNTGRVDFNRCAFTGNQAYNQGGGIAASGTAPSYVRVDSCRFYSNALTLPYIINNNADYRSWGGGIYLDTDASVSNSTFWDNRAGATAGGIGVVTFGDDRSVAITNCTLAQNRVLYYSFTGSGISAARHMSPASIVNVAIENTIAVQNASGTQPIVDFGDDGAPGEADQIYNDSYSGVPATVTVRNSCFNGGYSLGGVIGPTFSGTNNNINIDPSLTNLALGDLSLGDQSPCIDRGNTFVDLDPLLPGFQQLPAVDLAGQPRIVDGKGDGVVAVDMGAYEAAAQE